MDGGGSPGNVSLRGQPYYNSAFTWIVILTEFMGPENGEQLFIQDVALPTEPGSQMYFSNNRFFTNLVE